MAHFEYAVITALCDNQESWRTFRDQLRPEHFTRVDAQAAIRFIIHHGTQHSKAPSRAVLKDRFPSFPFEGYTDELSSLADRVHESFIYRKTAEYLDAVARTAQTDPRAAAALFMQHASALRSDLNVTAGASGQDITQQMQEEFDAYVRVEQAKGLLGWAYPWDILNRRTLGLERTQLVGFRARPKIGKTWYLMYLANHFHQTYGARTIVFSREMGVPALRRRYCAIVSRLDYDRYKSGKLTTPERDRWMDAREAISERSGFFVDDVAGKGSEAADEMIAKAKDFGADLIGIDGAYFYGDREWDELAKFTSRIKKHLIDNKLAGVLTTQTNQDGRVAYSDAILQDVDMLVNMVLDEEEQDRMHMNTDGLRDGRPASWQVWRRLATDLGEAYVDPDDADGDGGPTDVSV